MDILSTIKTWPVCHILYAFTFFISGIFINLLQAILYLLLRPFNVELFRKINYYLNYSSWSLIVALADWWSPCELRTYMNADDYDKISNSNEHALVIMNHSYEIEWLMGWLVAERVGVLGNTRVYAKKMLKYVPIIGWSWSLSDIIFLERDWNKDSCNLVKRLNTLSSYKDAVWVLLYCEGTRFTKEKHEASLKFAKENGLPLLKHHLTPRTKGFVFSVQNLKGKFSAIYDVTVGFSKDFANPTINSFLFGQKICADVNIRRIPLENVPTDSEEDCCKFLHDLYAEKDKVFDEYFTTGKFSLPPAKLKRRIYTLLNLIFWNLIVLLPTVYYLFNQIVSGSIAITFLIIFIIILFYIGIQKMMGVTSKSKGSSYGSGKKQISAEDKKLE